MSAERVPPPSSGDHPDPAGPGDRAPAGGAAARTRIDIPWPVFARGVLAILVAVGLLRFFGQVAAVVALVTLALFLTAVLSPLAAWLERRGLGRGLASLLALAVAVLVILALLALVIPPLVIEGIQFADDLPNQLSRLRRALAGYPAVFEALQRRATAIRQDPGEFFSGFLRFGAGAVTTVVSGVLILTLTLYFLSDRDRIRDSVLRHVPHAHRDRVDRTITGAAGVIRAYFTGQAIVSSIFAALTLFLLTLLGVPYASVLAAIAFVLDAVPNIGATLATAVPALVALSSEGLTDALIVAGVFLVYQQIENNLISPRVLGDKLEIPPALTLIAILVGGQVLGVIGVVLAIPLAGTLPVIERIWFPGEPSPPPGEPAAPLDRAA